MIQLLTHLKFVMANFEFKNVKGLHFVHFNVRSLLAKGKFDMFKTQVVCSGAQVVCLSETWLNPLLDSSLIQIPGYNLFRVDRKSEVKLRGGGVAVYIKHDMHVLEDLREFNTSSPDIEVQWLTIKLPHQKNFVLANLYRPPTGSVEKFCSALSGVLATAPYKANSEIFIMGDMNVNFLDEKHIWTQTFYYVAHHVGLSNILSRPNFHEL